MTTAQRISAALLDNGAPWKTSDGRSFNDLIYEHEHARDIEPNGKAVRYVFMDGSTITVAQGVWDLGYEHCFCWQGTEHMTGCEAA